MNHSIWRSALTALLLCASACAPVAFVAGAATGGAIVYDRRSNSTIITDQKIHHAIHLAWQQSLVLEKQSHIGAAVFNRIALLIGQVPNASAKQQAYQDAKQVPHLKRVVNAITVGPNSTAMQRSKDTWLTSRVKTELLLHEGLKSSQIKVVSEAGTVYLMGLVTQPQGKKAVELARNIHGVRRVMVAFEYVSVVE